VPITAPALEEVGEKSAGVGVAHCGSSGATIEDWRHTALPELILTPALQMVSSE